MFGATDALRYANKAVSSIVVDNCAKSPHVNGMITAACFFFFFFFARQLIERHFRVPPENKFTKCSES